MSKFKRFAANKLGNDYVVGDIHGHFTMLKTHLDRMNFDPSVDRLFSVGDLIDRGPESPQAMEWLNKSFFHAVMGNHEHMMIDGIIGNSSSSYSMWQQNGGEWFHDVTEHDLYDMANKFKTLPYAIEVELAANKKVGIIHAELKNVDWAVTTERLASIPHDSFDMNIAPDIPYLLWSRTKINGLQYYSEAAYTVAGIDRLICGHNIVVEPVHVGNTSYIDLSPYRHNRLDIFLLEDFVNGRLGNIC